MQFERTFGSVHSRNFRLVHIVEIAADRDGEVRISVKRPEQVRLIASVHPAIKPPCRNCPLRRTFEAGNGVNPGQKMNEQVARQTVTEVLISAPAEKLLGVKRLFWRVAQETFPINGLLVSVWWNRVNPRSACVIA